jgi:hypothetical protein
MSFWRRLLGCVGAFASTLTLASVTAAEPRPTARWANESALTTPENRLEIGLLSSASWAVHERVELSTHPVWALLLPQLHAKLRWSDSNRWHFSSAHGVAYPSLFLSAVAREGTLGLLPPDEAVPQALIVTSDALLTARIAHDHWLTARAGVAVAPRSANPVLLDFPFLYQRFAVLNAPLLARGGLALSATVWDRLNYELTSTVTWIPAREVAGGYAWESNAEASWSFTDTFRVSASTRVALSKMPVGTRVHWLPLLDARVAL